ncbi:alanine racemase [Tianweitania sp. BSSL-BM11]|uniref:Alanine racemase n=1 Tax=Tianweitania aestuarii TaxID=2814886 RepID=A0ABS5RSF6_9HYPH|nr:alanine racemase [Tianweitania aestuarii]
MAGGELIIDLDALKANYRALAEASRPAKAAGVVKANAYGLGSDVVVPALVSEGCTDFFVAMPEEGLAVRRLAPDARIFVLAGLFSDDVARLYAESDLTPVLNSLEDIAVWSAFCATAGEKRPCALHVDTGMTRLGLTVAEALAFAEDANRRDALNITLVMSHLACADELDHPMNQRQLESFQRVRQAFPHIDSSLANSAGVFLGSDFHQSLTRPGIGLYTGLPDDAAPQKPVVTLKARVVQVRAASSGEGVSYGSAVLVRDSILAVASVGYADGYLRAGSGTGVPLREVEAAGGGGFLHGRHVPVVGRITMDLTIFDVTDLGADRVQVKDQIELIGPNMPIESVARAAGTIPYEILTSLGARYHRRIVGGA